MCVYIYVLLVQSTGEIFFGVKGHFFYRMAPTPLFFNGANDRSHRQLQLLESAIRLENNCFCKRYMDIRLKTQNDQAGQVDHVPNRISM